MLTKTLKWIQEMYPDLNEQELAQKIETLVKIDVYAKQKETEKIEYIKKRIEEEFSKPEWQNISVENVSDENKAAALHDVSDVRKNLDKMAGIIVKEFSPKTDDSLAQQWYDEDMSTQAGIKAFMSENPDIPWISDTAEDTEYLPTSQKPKFKPGDRVRVTEIYKRLHRTVKNCEHCGTALNYVGGCENLDCSFPPF